MSPKAVAWGSSEPNYNPLREKMHLIHLAVN